VPTFGSLFAGIGGIDLGLERAGWQCRWQVEIDPFCRHVLEHHWPDVRRYGDIRDLNWNGVERVDLLAGGFPCQPFSVAGQRRGKDDERWLWPEFAAAVRALRPRHVLVENVPGLLAGHGGMGNVLGDLAQLGYDAEWDSVPAAAVGAPHLRYRVWIVAHANADELRLQPAGLAWGGCPPVLGVNGAFGSLADAEREGPQGFAWSWDASTGRAPVEPASSGEPLADADSSGLEGRKLQRECADQWPLGAGGVADPERGGRGRRAPEPGRGAERRAAVVRSGPTSRRSDHWLTEPDVGGTLDGFPAWLDRHRVGMVTPHMLALANAYEGGPREALRTVRGAADEAAIRDAAGGSVGVPASAVLLAYLRELEGHVDEGRLSLARAPASGASMRGVRQDEGAPRPPRQRRAVGQRAGEPANALHALSQLLARDAGQAWAAYRRENAEPVLSRWALGWEDGIARVAAGVPARVDRLRALGNAVVPQVVEVIGRRLLEVERAA
jgi:DNA (cytosine-5)-methyltransferase 1